MKGIREHHEKDFWSYVRFNRLCNRPGQPYFCPDGGSNFEKGNHNVLHCFVDFDSRGIKEVYPRDPDLLRLAVDGKKLVGLHLLMWAEGIAGGTLLPHEIMYELFDLPDWACDSLEKQVLKFNKEKYSEILRRNRQQRNPA